VIINQGDIMNRLIAAIAILAIASTAYAQTPQSPPLPDLRIPRASQGATVTQVIGMSEVTVFYHRPGVRGRTIWGPKGSGALQPNGEVWRAGANEPTLFTFSDDVTIAGKRLRAGTYRFLTIPGEKEWTVIFNSEVRNWGTVYEARYDTLRTSIVPQKGAHEEYLSFSFTDLTPVSATVVLAWEAIRIPIKLEFNLLPMLQFSVGNWSVLHAAARFAVDNNMYLKEAGDWIDRSLALDKNFFNLRTKAEILALNGKVQEAIAAGDEAMTIIRARGISTLPDFQQTAVANFEKLLASWKMK
jgi:hypothetical protein